MKGGRDDGDGDGDTDSESDDSDDGDEWLDANEAEPLFSGALDGNDDDEPIEFAHLEIEEDTASALADDDELDFSEAEDELDLSDAFMSDSPASGSGDASADADAEEEELLIADDADQMATKLDLARAYIDMGDSEGARVILGEVTEKGTAEQQQEASELLSRIG